MKIYRHGDLLIREINEFPKDLRKLSHTILAEGEATGHHHTLMGSCLVFENTLGQKFFQATKPTPLTHQEHDTIEIQKGKFKVVIEREFDPFKEEILRVRD